MERLKTIDVKQESVLSAARHPQHSSRLLTLYEQGVKGCAERDQQQVTAVLEELIGILDFKYGEIAEGFHRLYSFCLRKAQKGEFDTVALLLQDLLEIWAEAPAVTAGAPTGRVSMDDAT